MTRWSKPIPDKREGQAAAEARLVDFLCNVRPERRADITIASLTATHNVSAKVADYRLCLAQDRWRREDAARKALGLC